jgi:hypothetical protein
MNSRNEKIAFAPPYPSKLSGFEFYSCLQPSSMPFPRKLKYVQPTRQTVGEFLNRFKLLVIKCQTVSKGLTK